VRNTDSGFIEYTAQDFDAVKHVHELLSKPTETTAQLQFNVDFLKKKVEEKVLESHVDLMEGIQDLGAMDQVIQQSVEHIKKLRGAYNQVKEKISAPYRSIQKTSSEIVELNKEIVSFRAIAKFLQVYQRLETIMDQVEEFPRAAVYSYEIQSIIKDSEFASRGWIDEETRHAKEFHERLMQQGTEWLREGVESNNQILLSKAVLLFSNMRSLPHIISDLFDEYQSRLETEAKAAFDMEAIKLQLMENRKTQAGSVQKGNASALAEILWARIEKVTEHVYKYASHLHILDGFLSRKKDNVSQETYLQSVLTFMNCTSIRSHYWHVLSIHLDKTIRTATKNNPVLLQILQFGYPKLLRVFVELFTKISLLSGSEEQKSAETAVIMKTLSSFEHAYVSRTLTRMLDTVNSLIPEKGLSKGNPSTEEANKLCRSMSSELNAVRFDPHLLQAVGKNVTKAMSLFRARLMQTLGTASFTITGSTPGSAQIQKIDAINCLFALSDGLWVLVLDFVDTPAETILEEGAQSANDLMVSIAEPLFMSCIQELEPVLVKMHREEYTGKNLVNRNDPASLYMNEYVSKIRWVFRELISKLLCKHVTIEW
jgi:cell fate (sporulation/competence/biofilm development) regulator YlbF (YheA/YmcA/DUF963 family)